MTVHYYLMMKLVMVIWSMTRLHLVLMLVMISYTKVVLTFLKNVTITDSSGASGTIVKADIAKGTTVVATTSTSVGNYDGIESIVGEDLIRIQDSYFYQDYSYEVQIGASLTTYLNELKKAVHPSWFRTIW